MKKRDILKIVSEEFGAAEVLIKKGNISLEPRNKLEQRVEDYISNRSNDLREQGLLTSKDMMDFFENSLEEILKDAYPKLFSEDVVPFREFKKVSTKLRFKYIIEEVNNTGNSKWSHYEKHWKLQYSNLKNLRNNERTWENVDDVYFIKDSDGKEQEISLEEYEKLINKNKS